MHDLIIVGAGPVGATLALALAQSDLDVVVLDARPAGKTLRGDRSLALSHGARLILERVGAWTALTAIAGAITPIREIDVSQSGGFGVTRLAADDHGLPALGYVVSYVALQGALDAALERAQVAVRFGASVTDVGGTLEHARAFFAGDAAESLSARLAAVADGAGASVAGIDRTRRDYHQTAVVAKVWLDKPQAGVAYERFAADGPIALLPEGDHFGLVWTMAPTRAAETIELSDAAFLAALGKRLGGRVRGLARVAERRTFPLALEVARPTIATRAVVLGNAAQALHPVAAQGFNLGLRDAFELAQAIRDVPRQSIGGPSMLAAYAAGRKLDRLAGIAFTHGLVRIFGTDVPVVRWPRGVALALLNTLPPAKRAFTRAMLYGIR